MTDASEIPTNCSTMTTKPLKLFTSADALEVMDANVLTIDSRCTRHLERDTSRKKARTYLNSTTATASLRTDSPNTREYSILSQFSSGDPMIDSVATGSTENMREKPSMKDGDSGERKLEHGIDLRK
jgi:hypothetical protein